MLYLSAGEEFFYENQICSDFVVVAVVVVVAVIVVAVAVENIHEYWRKDLKYVHST